MVDSTWELTVLDAATPSREMNAVAAGDIDGDGHVELIIGGNDGITWYRPDTHERGVIDKMHSGVGGAVSDVDNDGVLEFVVGDANKKEQSDGVTAQRIYYFKPGKSLHDPWTKFCIDPQAAGQAHDIIFADIDNDGKDELIVNAVYFEVPGLYAYKPGADVTKPWKKITIQSGYVEEGLAAGDLDGDGYVEIVSGADWYRRPAAGPLTDWWERHIYAPSHREMCRVALLDVTGNGKQDIFIVDSEYMDGKLSWFENRLGEGGKSDFIEHPLQDGLIYAHSVGARHTADGQVQAFCAEMGQGGWGAPRNWNARVIEFISADKGATWRTTVISKGEGTHEAMFFDMDGDGEAEIVGKDAFEDTGHGAANSRVQLWKHRAKASPLTKFRHRFLDRDKPEQCIDLLVGDINGDGEPEIVCGKWWYTYSSGARHVIPGIHQAIALYDIDNDGKLEVIAMKPTPGETHFWNKLSSTLVWLKAIDVEGGKWEEFPIGQGSGNWPHGVLIAPLLPGKKLALVTGYHSAGKGTRPEIWEVPADPKSGPWPMRMLADIQYGEEFIASDIDGDGDLDIVAGATWLENNGDGTFTPHVIGEGFQAARVAVADFNGDGRPDILLGEEILEEKITPRSALIWFENPANPKTDPWIKHTVDTVRCAHSVAAADLDGDGEAEIVCGEHDPRWPYRNQCRLLVYKKADPAGLTWTRYTLDDRFEHHDGTKVIKFPDGRISIASHGWTDSIYVNLWELSQ